MVYEYSYQLYWKFLDGSSEEEVLIDALAGEGIPQVVSAGNQANAGLHYYRDTPNGQSVNATFDVPQRPQGQHVRTVQQSVLWLSSKGLNVSVQVTNPAGNTWTGQ
ncbi:MAG: hypothetical protein HY673_21145 [Chloroflexi bacterium]|nr:hypothetical protein [Chloroflexota bacterium]